MTGGRPLGARSAEAEPPRLLLYEPWVRQGELLPAPAEPRAALKPQYSGAFESH